MHPGGVEAWGENKSKDPRRCEDNDKNFADKNKSKLNLGQI
jgi:hypothetical protein